MSRFAFLSLGYHPEDLGGAFRYLAEVAERLAAQGHSVTVICPGNPDRGKVGEAQAGGVRVIRYPNAAAGGSYRNWRSENSEARRLHREWAREGGGTPLTVLVHAYLGPVLQGWSGPTAFLFTGPWGLEYRLAGRASDGGWVRRLTARVQAAVMHRVEGRALRSVGRIFTISEYYRTHLPAWHGAGLAPVEVVFGGVDGDRFHPGDDRGHDRRLWGCEPDNFVFLAVRRLASRMGLMELVEAFAGTPANTRLWVAGKGELRERLEERARALGLADRVRFLGYVPEEDLAGLFRAADCTVMPSLDLEGFGLTTVESLACGTPVLASDAGANPELVAPLGKHLIFPAGSVAGLAEVLSSVVASPELLPDRAKCREYVTYAYRWDRPVQALIEWGGRMESA